MRTSFYGICWVFVTCALLYSCGAPAPPGCRSIPRASRAPVQTLLEEARDAWIILSDPSRKEQWPGATVAYNSATAKLLHQLRCGGNDWNKEMERLGGRLSSQSAGRENPSRFDAIFPASEVDTKIVRDRHRSPGIGVELVGWQDTTPLGKARQRFQLPTGIATILNATLRFPTSGPPEWRLVRPDMIESISVNGVSHPLAVDWSAPIAFYWQMTDLDDVLIQNVFLPERYMDEIGLYFLEPYDPRKIPVVMVHGVNSSPDAFKFILNDLTPQPWFRKNYQIWLFNYPTGVPWIYTAARFRQSVREAVGYARSHGGRGRVDEMVVLAHSMGGLITRASVTDPGDAFYRAHFRKPLDQINLSPERRRLIEDATLYKPLTEPKRVVFMAVPHQGSPLADLRIALMASNFIRLPKMFTIDLVDAAVAGTIEAATPGKRFRSPTSISGLSPSNPDIKTLSAMPLPSGVVFHSIHGNRGRGTIPDCSDGVVSYQSSHVNPVESDLVVPWIHGVTDSPDTARELERILKLHLRTSRIHGVKN